MLNVYIFFLKIFIYSYTVPSPRIPNSRQYDAACRVDVPNWKYNDSRCRFGNETPILPFHQHKFGVKLVLKQLKINFIKVSLTGFIYLYTVQTPYISLQLNIQEEKRVYICICTFQEHRLCRVFFFLLFFQNFLATSITIRYLMLNITSVNSRRAVNRKPCRREHVRADAGGALGGSKTHQVPQVREACEDVQRK